MKAKGMNDCVRMMRIGLLTWVMGVAAMADEIKLESPRRQVQAALSVGEDGRLTYRVQRGDRLVIAPSPMGLVVDGKDLGQGSTPGKPVEREIDEGYPWLGGKSQVVNRAKSYLFPMKHADSKRDWMLEARVYDDGFAFRYRVPGERSQFLKEESTAWALPAGAIVWHQRVLSNYEGDWEPASIEKLAEETAAAPADKPVLIGLPVTIELPGGGFALITEARTYGYTGMALRAEAGNNLRGVFKDDDRGLIMPGEILSPWRLVMAVDDLDGLANCDLVANVCPPPDPSLFQEGTWPEWVRPGRCLWQWWAYDDPGTKWDKQKEFVDRAAELNCQYYLVDAGWEHPGQGWMEDGIAGVDSPANPGFPWHGKNSWQKLEQLCRYAEGKGIGIFVWRSWQDGGQSPGLSNAESRRLFFHRCAKAGVRGVKIDYFDHEDRLMLNLYEELTRLGAMYGIMVDFHGANKPAGEMRTWPNEITREGIKGLEHNKWSTLPRRHYAALPFTRFVVGPGDFTPTTFQAKMLKGTTVSQQLACAVVYTSPILCWADRPDVYLESPALPIIKQVPAVWDETRVLPGSAIGQVAAFARRSGHDWYVGIIHGGDEATRFALDLSFLGEGRFASMTCRDMPNEPARMKVEQGQATSADKLEITLSPGGGFVGQWLHVGQ